MNAAPPSAKLGRGGGVEEGAVSRVTVIEDIVDATVDMERLVDLIRGVNIEDGAGRQLCRLIGIVTNEILAAHIYCVGANLEGVGDGIVKAGLDAVAWDGRDLIAWKTGCRRAPAARRKWRYGLRPPSLFELRRTSRRYVPRNGAQCDNRTPT